MSHNGPKRKRMVKRNYRLSDSFFESFQSDMDAFQSDMDALAKDMNAVSKDFEKVFSQELKSLSSEMLVQKQVSPATKAPNKKIIIPSEDEPSLKEKQELWTSIHDDYRGGGMMHHISTLEKENLSLKEKMLAQEQSLNKLKRKSKLITVIGWVVSGLLLCLPVLLYFLFF